MDEIPGGGKLALGLVTVLGLADREDLAVPCNVEPREAPASRL
jgi:hypothetical protein